ncbi:Phospholipid scramblase family protein [Thalictrum thalictroides]|uniref:Phospholipid scramblase n=1 Tax=Thalictrum thalictroides TaxID=46969 RepID=A0A7J6X0U6_THATH|nr:Phospholipid scramblase family protein [Thalictrum thalictroides]
MMNQIAATVFGGGGGCRGYANSTNDHQVLSREWFVKLWLADEKNASYRPTTKNRYVRNVGTTSTAYASVPEDGFTPTPLPPLTQSAIGVLEPTTPQEYKVAPLLLRSNLLITRDIEWANLMLGFEQENRYAVVDAYYPQAPVGFISEQSNVIARQILRTRRPFIAKITDSMGNELFRVRRPFWWITSTIFAEIDGKEIGVVHRRWHLWRRVYDLYLGNKQFAVVENPGFWNWTFTLKDIDGNVLAEIDRDWRGFGFEVGLLIAV